LQALFPTNVGARFFSWRSLTIVTGSILAYTLYVIATQADLVDGRANDRVTSLIIPRVIFFGVFLAFYVAVLENWLVEGRKWWVVMGGFLGGIGLWLLGGSVYTTFTPSIVSLVIGAVALMLPFVMHQWLTWGIVRQALVLVVALSVVLVVSELSFDFSSTTYSMQSNVEGTILGVFDHAHAPLLDFHDISHRDGGEMDLFIPVISTGFALFVTLGIFGLPMRDAYVAHRQRQRRESRMYGTEVV
jgi:hypothetical protein